MLFSNTPRCPRLLLKIGSRCPQLTFSHKSSARILANGLMALFLVIGMSLTPAPAQAQVSAFRQAVAEAAARDPDLAAFYRARGFDPVWSGADDAAVGRRNALLGALTTATVHGLPANRYDPQALVAELRAARTPQEQGRMEVELSRIFLSYARDIQTGILVPRDVVNLIRREVPLRDRGELMHGFMEANPAAFFRSLPPTAPEYIRLLRERLHLETVIDAGGWGPRVPSGLSPGASGETVVALRNRLVAMGFLERTVTQTYDASIIEAVRRFQAAHGLEQDGVLGASALREINEPAGARMQSILVAMERERWMNMPRGDRHVWVNLTDFTATIVDFDEITFRTRAVIGAGGADRQTPEFSDVMEHMVINPSWYIPRSIIVNEYLPRLRSNPGAVSHLQITDSRGRVVNRATADFSRFSAASFPYAMRQPPGPRNALGVVKFIFPNPLNIYLHDTPSRSLFAREVRAFSHGCIRLNDPRDFAYALLAVQSDDPVGLFQGILRSGRETHVELDVQVPVHLVYRTAYTSVDGQMQYRNDIYGRDARIWSALAREGVAISDVQG